jgi:hypothetical protein
MLFRETVAVYCDNHAEHKNTVGKMKVPSLRWKELSYANYYSCRGKKR